MRPISQSDGHDRLWLIDEFVPGLATGLDDGVIIFEDAVREPILAEVPEPPGRTCSRLLQSARHGGAAYQGRQERHQVDAAVMPQVPQQRGSASASRTGVQSGQLHAHAGSAEGSGALVADYAAGEASEDRCQGRPPWSLRYIPTG